MATKTTGFLQPVAEQPDQAKQATNSNESPKQDTSVAVATTLIEGAPTVTVITHSSAVPSNYITIQESDLASEASSESSRPPYIHYVETSNQAVFASTNGDVSYSYSANSSMESGMYSQVVPASGDYSSQVASLLNDSLSNGYFVQEGGITDEDGRIISPNSSRDTVQWLLDNYETAEGVSLPRSTLYNHYLRYCSDMKIEPINAASFGKLIRSVFVNIRTRRLGTRGNSKYHYYGIRVKLGSYLTELRDDLKNISSKPHNSGNQINSDSFFENGYFPSSTNIANSKHLQFLGDSSDAIPIFPSLDASSLTSLEGVQEEDVNSFKMLYKEHCEAFLDSIINLNFVMVETIWQTFWRTYSSSHILNELEKLLTKSKLYLLSTQEPVLRFMQETDLHFYQNLVDILIPDVLRPIPSTLTQSIRHFAKNMENWLIGAMKGCPREVIIAKLGAVSAFAQTLRRYTSLNHLAQAGRAVLQNPVQVTQMAIDLNKVDFNHIKEQASWVCQCDEGLVRHLSDQLKEGLREKRGLDQWAEWLEKVVHLVLATNGNEEKTTAGEVCNQARSFLLKWSFYCSLIIRDLTLRSAASFGSFHLLRLLYDEYIFYLIEHKVAGLTGKVAISVTSVLRSNPLP